MDDMLLFLIFFNCNILIFLRQHTGSAPHLEFHWLLDSTATEPLGEAPPTRRLHCNQPAQRECSTENLCTGGLSPVGPGAVADCAQDRGATGRPAAYTGLVTGPEVQVPAGHPRPEGGSGATRLLLPPPVVQKGEK